MKRLDFFFDCASPESYLAFEYLPQALQGLSYRVRYLPLLQAGGAKPQPTDPEVVFEHCAALARDWGIPLQRPAHLNFDARPWALLAWAQARQGAPNRYGVETVLRHIWNSGQDAGDPTRLNQELQTEGQGVLTEASMAALLGQAGEAARQAGVQHAPAWVMDGRVFHGLQAWPELRQQLELLSAAAPA